jgi:hypothetical protein
MVPKTKPQTCDADKKKEHVGRDIEEVRQTEKGAAIGKIMVMNVLPDRRLQQHHNQ